MPKNQTPKYKLNEACARKFAELINEWIILTSV